MGGAGERQFAGGMSEAKVSTATVPRRHPRKSTATFSVVFLFGLNKMYQGNVLDGTKR